MERTQTHNQHIRSVAEQHQLMGLARPLHPLFSITRFSDFPPIKVESRVRLISELYYIALKEQCPCKLQYGQTQYDFDEGVMSFFSPKQVSVLEEGSFLPHEGWLIAIHPDFFRDHPFSLKLKGYTFFDYMANEALLLSYQEQRSLETLFLQIEWEAALPVDNFSKDVILTNVDLLLTYCNRYYSRQFIMRF